MIIKKIYHKMKYYDINMNEFKKKISMIKNCLFKNKNFKKIKNFIFVILPITISLIPK
jgi:hypothetical protein